MKSTQRIIDCEDVDKNCTDGLSRTMGEHDERVILPDGTSAPAGPSHNQYTGIAENPYR